MRKAKDTSCNADTIESTTITAKKCVTANGYELQKCFKQESEKFESK
jgi:hypothetical protein